MSVRSLALSTAISHSHFLHSVHLERLGAMSEDTVRFYVAQISSGLAFLHEMGIMHR